MAFDYDGAAKTALSLLKDFGKTMTLIQETAKAGSDPFDPAEPDENTFTVTGVLLDIKDKDFPDSKIIVGDRKAIIAARGLATTPAVGDVLKDGADEYQVIVPMPLNPAGTAVIHTLQIRR